MNTLSLVGNDTRREVSLALVDGFRGSVRQLSDRTGFAYATVHAEVEVLCEAGVARQQTRSDGVPLVEPAEDSPLYQSWRDLLQLAAPEAERRRILHESVAFYSGCFPSQGKAWHSPYATLVQATLVARGEAQYFDVMPVLLHRVADSHGWNWPRLLRTARAWSAEREVGMMLSVYSELSGDYAAKQQAVAFVDGRSWPTEYWNAKAERSAALRRAADLHKLPWALDPWGYVVGNSAASLRSFYNKYRDVEQDVHTRAAG